MTTQVKSKNQNLEASNHYLLIIPKFVSKFSKFEAVLTVTFLE